ncbi:hypothetical protein AGMMS49975_27740 [Clostridia bacterium]|nr:hypothetical protein AGMMS49975_27740 [Clostridia bacterium]
MEFPSKIELLIDNAEELARDFFQNTENQAKFELWLETRHNQNELDKAE